jgi:hypothetical protein
MKSDTIQFETKKVNLIELSGQVKIISKKDSMKLYNLIKFIFLIVYCCFVVYDLLFIFYSLA